jgi:hypothetical protein
VWVK